jgi:hypothetical protein
MGIAKIELRMRQFQAFGASKNFSLIVMFFPEIYFKRNF